MEIPQKKPIRYRVAKYMVLALIGISVLSFGWLRIKAYSNETYVNADELIIANVEKGDLIREVSAPGTLVPVDLNFLAAATNGRVEQIFQEAGDSVDVGTVIMRLVNPELSQAADAARYELETLQADYQALQLRLNQEQLKQRIVMADFKARFEMAKLRREAYQKLLQTGAASDINYNESALREQQLKIQFGLEEERLKSLPQLHKAELTAARAKIDKAQRGLDLQLELIDRLSVKATTKGVLQEVLLEKGEQVRLGTVLARIAEQDNLKAQLRVQESQVKNVRKGQSVVIAAGGNTAKGKVKRIDPAVQQGTVLVDVYFTGLSLEGARPDLRIDGTIELEHLKNVLQIKRPVFSQEYASTSLFVLNHEKDRAVRTTIKLGRGSVDVIEVLSELEVGDQVVVSSTKKFNELEEIALH